MKIVVAGGSGLLGQALQARLSSDRHEIVLLSRRATGSQPSRQAAAGSPHVATVAWTPDGTVGEWAAVVDGADAVVNLAGESIAAARWSEAQKQRILESRIHATASLVAAIRAARRQPATFLSASAQGFYGDRGDEELTEESGPSRDFLADVCVRWEAEATRAAPASRVVLLRTGIVLDASGGALPQMVRPFKFFGGGPLGSGRQFMPWIHIADWVRMAAWALDDERVRGPLNLSAPEPVRNKTFATALGVALGRPSWAPAPAFALRLAVGEMAGPLLLASTRMLPAKARSLGFEFEHADLATALAALVR